MNYFYIVVAGLGGGLVRGLIGYIKYQFAYKNVGFNLPYFFGMMFLSGVIGFLCAAAVNGLYPDMLGGIFTPAIAFVAGYAGGDLLDNLYKIIFKKDAK